MELCGDGWVLDERSLRCFFFRMGLWMVMGLEWSERKDLWTSALPIFFLVVAWVISTVENLYMLNNTFYPVGTYAVQ